MNTRTRAVAPFLFPVVFFASMFLPFSAFAQSYYPYQGYQYPSYCNDYTTTQYYGGGYWNPNCYNRGTLNVYVQVQEQYNYADKSPSDFTIYVSGAHPSQQYFQGSQSGTSISLVGSYSVSVYNQIGYVPSYSSECSGSVGVGETRTCYVTLAGDPAYYPRYPYHQYSAYYPTYPQYQSAPQYQPVPAIYVSTIVPTALPNTGFEPLSATTAALATVLLVTIIMLFFPYARKTLTTILG